MLLEHMNVIRLCTIELRILLNPLLLGWLIPAWFLDWWVRGWDWFFGWSVA
jgi:hypothetical protein